MTTLLIFITITTLMRLVSSDMIQDFIYYKRNDLISVSVGSMNSVETQLPFDFYYLQICPPDKIVQESDNLGDILTGDVLHKSRYQFQIGVNENCKKLCELNLTGRDVNLLEWMIDRNYSANWYVDKLPAGMKHVINPDIQETEVHYLGGIPLGYKELQPVDSYFYKIYNHYTFTIEIHSEGENNFSVVGFNIMPFSINQNSTTGLKCSERNSFINYHSEKQGLAEGNTLITYDIIYQFSKVSFSSRWDHYLHLKNDNIHWYSLINSALIILIFSFVVLHIFCRSLKRDIDIYNTKVTEEEFIDEFGWKQVCNDVFRRPPMRMLLSSMIGTGMQLFAMISYTLIFAVIGFLSPEKRGALLMTIILLFVFMGVFAGYFSARFYKMFGGKAWLKNTLLTAFLYPGILFTILIILNILFWLEGSSAKIRFVDIIVLLVLWICCSAPLVLIGSFIGLKKKVIKNPCKVNSVPSSIPHKPWYLKLRYIVLISGIIPFGAIFIELVYIMASIWRHYFYYLFGFLLIVLILLIITCSEISIILTYVYLCKGDYNWWWRSFLISGSPAFYVFVYSIYYFFNLHITRLSSLLLYFALMSILTSIIFLITGTLGFLMTYLFIKKIYSMIKID